MDRLDLALDGLRTTLLTACGLSLAACTPTSPAPSPTGEATAEPRLISEREPDPRPTTTPEAANCPDPTPVLANGQDTGYVRCADGAINRAQIVACAEPIAAPACEGTETRRDCNVHADCTDKAHGFCMSGSGQIGSYCGCIYPCLDDGECKSGEACMCPGVGKARMHAATCAPATCKVNGDCASGECGATFHFNGCGSELSLECRQATDKCHADSDCEEPGDCAALDHGGDPTVGFQCASYSCVIGRPLTVDDGVRVASLVACEWGAARVDGLAPSRGRAAYWLDVARMEHASVASFARFAQELLHFGAPPDLLTDALAAAADEVRHAERTFALASAYADAPRGPGALRVDDLRPTRDLELFVTRLIVEGCVGETLGVAEALALLDQDLDPILRPELERIATDETRHAALAWRTLAWVAGRVDAEVVERAFERGLIAVTAAGVGEEPSDPAHGLLGTEVKRRARARAIAAVVEPCRRELHRGL